MSSLEAVLLGAMLAYTPSMVVLATSLWNVPELDEDPVPHPSPCRIRPTPDVAVENSAGCEQKPHRAHTAANIYRRF
jgi:hypothetical protein